MKYLTALALTALLFFYRSANAQNITLQGRLLDARTSMPVGGATVALLSLTDTISYSYVTGMDGYFRIIRIPQIGRYIIKLRKDGYANYLKMIELKSASDNLGDLVMVDSAHLLQEATVKSKRKAFTVKGDTIEYSSSYYKTNPDMDAVYLLNKMPGIDLINMKANGDSISKMLINGIVIFGDRPANVLALIPAGLIDKVMVYPDSGEVNNTGVKNINHAKVISIQTTDKALTRPKGKVYAGWGSSDVYIAGANAIRQKEKKQLSVDGSINRGNISTAAYYTPSYQFSSIGILTVGKLNINYTKPISKSDQLNLSYGNYNTYHSTKRSSLYQYTLDSGTANISEVVNDGWTAQRSNDATIGWRHLMKNKNTLQINVNARQYYNETRESVTVNSVLEGVQATSATLNRPGNDGYSAGGSLNYAINTSSNSNYTIRLSYRYESNDQYTEVIGHNSTPDTLIPVNFRNTLAGTTSDLSLSIVAKNKISAHNALNCSLRSDYSLTQSSQSRDLYSQLTMEYSDPDTFFTTAIRYASLNSSAEIRDVINPKGGSITIELGSGLQHARIHELNGVFTNDYLSLNPFVDFTKRYSALKQFSINLSRTSEIPGYKLSNPIINASSNYTYSVGNIGIQPAPRYDLSASYKSRFLTKGSLFNTRAAFIYIKNNISASLLIPSSTGFYYDGRLIPIGAQLTYYQNYGDYKCFYYGISIDAPIEPIRVVAKFNTNFQSRSTEVLINNSLARTVTYDYIAAGTFNSIISKKLDFVVYLAYNINQTVQERNSIESRRNLHLFMANALITAQVADRQTLKLETNYNTTSGLTSSEPTQFFLLDLSYQLKLLKSQKLSATITGHDLLDSYKNYGFEYKDNAIYSFTTNSIGRYLLLSMNYSF